MLGEQGSFFNSCEKEFYSAVDVEADAVHNQHQQTGCCQNPAENSCSGLFLKKDIHTGGQLVCETALSQLCAQNIVSTPSFRCEEIKPYMLSLLSREDAGGHENMESSSQPR